MRKIVIFFLLTLSLYAHQMRENYLKLEYDASTKTCKVLLEVETRLLEDETLLDDNKNSIISYKELQHHKEYLFTYVQKHFFLMKDDKLLSLKGATLTFHRYKSQTYLTIEKTFNDINLDSLTLEYSLFFELEKNHKLLIHLDKTRGDYVLDTNNRHYSFSSYKMTQLQRFSIFVKTGFKHILDGIDHLLFILMILLPSIIKGIRASSLDIFKIITTFTLAHSLTLFLSASGILRPNVTFIESSIALSIFIVALLNFFGFYKHVNKKIVFTFGLLHGFGFANVLEIAGVDDTLSFLVALFGFNLGVEFGQMSVILLYLPLLYLVSVVSWRANAIKGIALLTAFVSAYWFLQRLSLV